MGFLGDLVDNVSTRLGLPETGLSELLNGGQKTTNTGTKKLSINGLGEVSADQLSLNDKGQVVALVNGKQYATDSQQVKDFYNATRPSAGGGTGTANVSGNDVSDPTANGGAGGAGSRDLAAEAFYETGISNIDALISALPAREQSALTALLNSYAQTKARQDVAFGDNKADYDKNVEKTIRDDARKKTQIDTNVRNDMSALRRVLGARGAGSSSAYNEVVPGAVTAKGSAERADAAQVTADNMDTLDENWKRYDREWQQNRADTDTQYENNQKDIKTQFAQSGIDARQKKLELQTNLASARGGGAGAIAGARSVGNEINDLQAKINALAERAAGRTVTDKDVTMTKSENKDFAPEANTSTAQTTPNTQDQNETAFYDKEKEGKTDEDLLRELLNL